MAIEIEIRRLSSEIGGYPLTEAGYNWFEDECDEDVKDTILVAIYDGIHEEDEMKEFRTALFDSDYSGDYSDAIQEFIESIGADGDKMEPFYESPLYVGAVSCNDSRNFPIILNDEDGNSKDINVIVENYEYTDKNWQNTEYEIDQWWEKHDDEVQAYMKEHNIDKEKEDEVAEKLGIPEYKDNPKYSNWVLVFESISKGSWSGPLPDSVETFDDVDPTKFTGCLMTPYSDFGDYVSVGGFRYADEDIDLEEEGMGYESLLTAIEG